MVHTSPCAQCDAMRRLAQFCVVSLLIRQLSLSEFWRANISQLCATVELVLLSLMQYLQTQSRGLMMVH